MIGAVLAPSVQASRWPPVQRRVRSHSQPLPAQASHQQRNRGHRHNARLAAKSSFAGFTRIYAAIDSSSARPGMVLLDERTARDAAYMGANEFLPCSE
jgi:hypothetical protein